MAYLERFEHDLFVSYAHVDDLPDRPDLEEQKGWVERFASRLSVALLKRLGEHVDVWRDPRLKRSERFEPVIDTAVRGSALFLSLLSNRYLKSESCRRELEAFVEAAAASELGLGVGEQSRIFPLLLYDIPASAWPGACQGSLGFPFHDAPDGRLGRPLDPDGEVRRFDEVLHRLVGEIADLLEVIRRRETEAAGTERDATSYRVYLAATADSLAREKRRIASSLEAQGIEVVGKEPPIPPPYHREAHARVVVKAVREADLSLHLLDGLPGTRLEGALHTTYPQEQCRLALEHARSQLVILPEFFAPEEIEEEEYRRFLDDLQRGGLAPAEGSANRLEVARASSGRVPGLVLARREEKLLRAEVTARGAVFIDLHPEDLPAVGELVRYLEERRLTAVTMPGADLSPVRSGSLFEENLVGASAFLIVYGRVARSWVKARLERALQLIVRHDLDLRPAIFAAPPAKSPLDLGFRFCEVIDAMGRFDGRAVASLLPAGAESPP